MTEKPAKHEADTGLNTEAKQLYVAMWERIHYEGGETQGDGTERMAVPGGWLYRTYQWQTSSDGWTQQMAVAFVPLALGPFQVGDQY